jgi:MFS family permease
MFCLLGAALVGLAAAPLWTAKATYLNQIARYHSQHKNQTHEISVSLFFGIFFSFFGTNTIWGNLISYFVLNQYSNPQISNCGVYFDPQSAVPTNTTQDVNDTTVKLFF